MDRGAEDSIDKSSTIAQSSMFDPPLGGEPVFLSTL